MIVVVNFDKRLDLGPLLDLLLAHSSFHRTGMSIDASHESMTVGPVSCAIIVVLIQNPASLNLITHAVYHNASD